MKRYNDDSDWDDVGEAGRHLHRRELNQSL